MNLAIVGSRELVDYEWFKSQVNQFIQDYGNPNMIISGGAKGADTLARMFANEMKIPIKEFIPDWSIGRHAGILRNTDIIKESTHVLAFPSNNGKGTQDSIAKAKQMNKIGRIIYID